MNNKSPEELLSQSVSSKKHVLMGFVFSALVVFGLGGWSIYTAIDGAVITSGEFRYSQNRQLVQHGEGGTIESILVSNGTLVKKNTPLIIFDHKDLLVERDLLLGRLQQAEAQIARLKAERDDLGEVPPPLQNEGIERKDLPMENPFFVGQVSLFEVRRNLYMSQIERITEVIKERKIQMDAIDAQLRSTELRLGMAKSQIDRVKSLQDNGFATQSSLDAAESGYAEIDTEISAIIASRAVARSELASLEKELHQVSVQRFERATDELGEVEANERELVDNLRLIKQRLDRSVVRSPVDGIVADISVFSTGAVVGPGEPILSVVPKNSELIVEARIPPVSIDLITVDQEVILKLPSFDINFTPEVKGHVIYVSPDIALIGAAEQEPYYPVWVTLTRQSVDDLENVDLFLLSGMQAEVYLLTGSRSPLSYLTKPLTDQFYRAFR